MQLTHGCMILVHPIADEQGRHFLPCIYGYAMTARKAQGSTLAYAVLYFDLWMPAPRGQAYVASSRVTAHDRLYYFGKVRRNDWLPVGGPGAPIEQVDRDVMSQDSNPDLDYERSSNSDSSSMSSHGEFLDDSLPMDLFGDVDDDRLDAEAVVDQDLFAFPDRSDVEYEADVECLFV